MAQRCPSAQIVGVDLLPCEQLAGVSFIQGDFTDVGVVSDFAEQFQSGLDLLLSDAAPDLSGIKIRDQANCEKLHEAVFTVATSCRAKVVVLKTFMGVPLEFARDLARTQYQNVRHQRLKSSKKSSLEAYVIATEQI